MRAIRGRVIACTRSVGLARKQLLTADPQASCADAPRVSPSRFRRSVRPVEHDGSQPVKVTYAFVDKNVASDDTRNCRGMVPVDGLFAQSGVSQILFLEEVRVAFDMWERVPTSASSRRQKTSNPVSSSAPRQTLSATLMPMYSIVKDGTGTQRQIDRSLICLEYHQALEGHSTAISLSMTCATPSPHEIGHAIGLNHPSRTDSLCRGTIWKALRFPAGGRCRRRRPASRRPHSSVAPTMKRRRGFGSHAVTQ